MKTNTFTKIAFSVFFCAALALSSSESVAQGQTRIGGQLAFGTKDLGIGFGARGEFSITDNISIVPKFTYYLGKNTDTGFGDVGFSAWALDADAHYYFTTDGTNFYGLAGLAYNSITVTTPAFPPFFSGGSVSDSKIGLNVGAGASFTAGNLFPFVEVRYNTALEAVLISAGVSFPIGGK